MQTNETYPILGALTTFLLMCLGLRPGGPGTAPEALGPAPALLDDDAPSHAQTLMSDRGGL